MAKSLSIDLRERLVSAVEGGMTRRSAAKRFGVAASTAIKWMDRWRRTGSVAPRPRGGDRHSTRMEAHAEEVLGLIGETPDITLAELAEHLHAAHGLKVDPSTVWRLLDRHGMTFKKKPRTPASNSALTFCIVGGPGSRLSRIWILSGWSSSTKPEPRPRWRGAMVGRHVASAAGRRCPTDIGKRPPSSARSVLKG